MPLAAIRSHFNKALRLGREAVIPDPGHGGRVYVFKFRVKYDQLQANLSPSGSKWIVITPGMVTLIGEPPKSNENL